MRILSWDWFLREAIFPSPLHPSSPILTANSIFWSWIDPVRGLSHYCVTLVTLSPFSKFSHLSLRVNFLPSFKAPWIPQLYAEEGVQLTFIEIHQTLATQGSSIKAQESSLHFQVSQYFTGIDSGAQLFTWVLRTWTQIFMVARQALCGLSYLPSTPYPFGTQ